MKFIGKTKMHKLLKQYAENLPAISAFSLWSKIDRIIVSQFNNGDVNKADCSYYPIPYYINKDVFNNAFRKALA